MTATFPILKLTPNPAITRPLVYMWIHGKNLRFSVYYGGFKGYLPALQIDKKDSFLEHINAHLQLPFKNHMARVIEKKQHPSYANKPYPIRGATNHQFKTPRFDDV